MIMKLISDTDPSEARQIFDILDGVGRNIITRLVNSNDEDTAKNLCKSIISLLQNGNTNVVTSFHTILMKLYAKDNNITDTLKYIILDDYQLLNEKFMTKFKKPQPAINPASLISYFYYSGNALMKEKRYVDAFVCYESVIHICNKVPNITNDIFYSSIKRYILSGILAFQRSPLMNVILPNETIRNFNIYSADYVSIHKIFKNGLAIDNNTFSNFSTTISTLSKKLDDENKENCEYLLLIKELVVKQSVIKFAKVYDKMTIDDLMRKSFVPDTINIHKYLSDLVDEKLINVSISDNRIVTFIDKEEIDTSSVYHLCSEIEVAQKRLNKLKDLLFTNFSNENRFVDGKFDNNSLEIIACTEE
uniref:COP9 signalosome complex subunit 3 n=1 Tax=Strongyloides papillosus TaxID=174720 RepID=A0A0N5BAA6_STREA